MKFSELNINEATKKAIYEYNLEDLTPIQELVIPEMLKGIDIIAQAKTGTGKTFAFAIPIIEKVDINGKTQSLVLCPTRELAIQVFNEFLKLVKYQKEITVAAIVGGESYERQFKSLKRNPHIIVGTPGRIIDHLNRGTIDLSKLKYLTFDEADEMLKMGFKEDIETILKGVSKEIQTTLFSATTSKEIKTIAKTYQNNAISLSSVSDTLTVEKIEEAYYVVKKEDKYKLITRLLDLEEARSVIIFTNTKREADEVSAYLTENNYNANSLHGDLKQKERAYVTNNFRNKNLNILVATDVAARGLDIKGVELVINLDMPQELEVYVHRIGRTARAGQSGKAYTLLTPRTEYKIKNLENFTKTTIKKLEVPTQQAIYKYQRNNFVKNYALKASGEVIDQSKIIKEFENVGIYKEELLNMLLTKVLPSKKEYEDIAITKPSQSRNEKQSKKDRPQRSQKNFLTFKINLGRKDGVSPILILDILGSKYNIRGGNVGDIKHYQTYTLFNVSIKATNLMKQTNFNYKGKKIEITLDTK